MEMDLLQDIVQLLEDAAPSEDAALTPQAGSLAPASAQTTDVDMSDGQTSQQAGQRYTEGQTADDDEDVIDLQDSE